VLEGGMAETIIGGALVGILEDFVGFVDFLETMLGVLVARIAIRVALHRVLAEGRLDIDLSRGALDRKRLVVAALHCSPDSLFKNKRPRFDAGAQF
jgi:hypothetical protein